MFKVEILLNKNEGFKVVGYFKTEIEAQLKVELYKWFYKTKYVFYKQVL